MFLDDEGNLRQCTIDSLSEKKIRMMPSVLRRVSTVVTLLKDRLQSWQYHRLMEKINKTYLPAFLKRVAGKTFKS